MGVKAAVFAIAVGLLIAGLVVRRLWLEAGTSLGDVLAAGALLPLLWISLARLGALGLLTRSWAVLIPPAERPPFHRLFRLRWIGDAINNLLPVLQVGGDLARARLLTIGSGVAAATAGAVLVLDLTLGTLSQAIYTLSGALVLLKEGAVNRVPVGPVLIGVLLAVAGLTALLVALGFGRLPLHGLFRATRAWFKRRRVVPSESSVDVAMTMLSRRRGALASSFVWHFLAWLAQAAEIWLLLHLRGAPVPFATALVIESLAGAARAAAFFLPGGLGVQEGALAFLALTSGISSAVALELVVLRRLREIAVGLPALAVWGFHERRLLDGLVRQVLRGRST
jgi:putative membrane protein